MDLGVQNKVDQIVTREKIFFANCSRKLKPAEREEEYEKIKNEYETQKVYYEWQFLSNFYSIGTKKRLKKATKKFKLPRTVIP